MRIRTIKPEFWLHEGLCSCTEFARLLAIALLNWSDDHGYFFANPALIRGSLFPFVEDSQKIPSALQELTLVGWIHLGIDHQSRSVGRVVNFSKHQRVDKPKPSEIKASSTFQDESKTNPGIIQDASQEERKGMEGKRNGMDIAPPAGAVCEPVLTDNQKDLELETESLHSNPSEAKPKQASTNSAKAKAETPEQVEEFALSIGGTRGQGTAWFWKMQGQGWINGGKPVKDWKATVRSHHMQGYLPIMDPSRPVIPIRATVPPQVEQTFATWEDDLRDQGLDEEAIERRRRVVSMSAPEPVMNRSKATA